MTVTNNLRPTTFQPVQRERPSIHAETHGQTGIAPERTRRAGVAGGLVGNHVNTTA